MSDYERYMLKALQSLGMPEDEKRPDAWVLGKELADQGEKATFQAWTCESLLYAIREIALNERCHWRVVLRCFGQAKHYLGRTNGLALNCHVNDCLSYVQNELERKLYP